MKSSSSSSTASAGGTTGAELPVDMMMVNDGSSFRFLWICVCISGAGSHANHILIISWIYRNVCLYGTVPSKHTFKFRAHKSLRHDKRLWYRVLRRANTFLVCGFEKHSVSSLRLGLRYLHQIVSGARQKFFYLLTTSLRAFIVVSSHLPSIILYQFHLYTAFLRITNTLHPCHPSYCLFCYHDFPSFWRSWKNDKE